MIEGDEPERFPEVQDVESLLESQIESYEDYKEFIDPDSTWEEQAEQEYELNNSDHSPTT